LIKDFNFSKELQESLSAAAQAKRTGESKIISAKAEVDSAKLMREAADILSTPSAMQIRYLDTLNSLSKAPQTRIVFLPPAEQGANNSAVLNANGQSTSFGPLQAQNYLNLSQ
jgi:erythrocyte band 7 integral membrane protein